MKILITGATGFVGRNLVKELVKEHEVYVLTRKSSDISALPPVHHVVFTDNIDLLAEYFKAEGIEGVIHLATKYVAAHKSEQIKDIVLSNIYFGTAVLEASVRGGVKWFINTGTIWQNFQVPDYSDEYCPVNLYAASKQAFMTMARYYLETTGIRFSTLKLCDTYGENDTRRKIMDLFREYAQSGDRLEMSPGDQLIDIVHVSKVIEAFKRLIKILADHAKEYRSEYVVTSGKQISLRELAKKYETEHNVKLNIVWGGRPYRDREVMKPYIGVPI